MPNGSLSSTIRLLRTGIVPLSAIEPLSVGYSRLRTELTTESQEFLSGNHQVPLFIQGEWGTGKSHALGYCRAFASKLGIPTAFVSLNARTVPLNHPQRIYGELAASLRVGHTMGLRPLLHSILTNLDVRMILTRYLSSSSNPLSSHIRSLCKYYDCGEALNPQAEASWGFILGEDLGWADYAYKREQAIERIYGLADCFRAINGGGILMLMDEVETIDQLWNHRSRAVAYSVMTSLSTMQPVWSIFAVTERFRTLVALDAARSHVDSVSHHARWLSNALANGAIHTFDTPRLDGACASRLAAAITALYLEAYPQTSFSKDQIQRCVDEWGKNPGRNPRKLIRAIVNRLDLARPLPEA
ncbi:MAG TPA: BREX system ATP-binding domain-containing protein [Acidobacteriaceae bacterium]|jgi:hypothetical protein|nr:BREX system ATP-binding domain-containing protein [Acidobacteriaceae bacterium]